MIDDSRMYSEPRNNGIATVTAGFLVGAIVGAGVALLLAPASGRETRERLGGVANKLGGVAKDGLSQLGGVAKDGLSQARSALGGIKDDATAAIDAGRDAVRQRRSTVDTTMNT